MKDKTMKAYFSRMARKAAKARMEKIPPEKRKRIAAKAAKARWAKRKKEGTC